MQATKGQKYCATCSHWNGERDVRSKSVYFDSSQSKGKCYHPNGPWKNQEKQATASCPKHETWSPLL